MDDWCFHTYDSDISTPLYSLGKVLRFATFGSSFTVEYLPNVCQWHMASMAVSSQIAVDMLIRCNMSSSGSPRQEVTRVVQIFEVIKMGVSLLSFNGGSVCFHCVIHCQLLIPSVKIHTADLRC